MGEKEEINSSEANTIPNSQNNINFGWWLAFILFCLDEQNIMGHDCIVC